MDKLIKVSEYVYFKLNELKERDGHKSFDSVIRYLIDRDQMMTVVATCEKKEE
jgi:predicted CopG family antitoxin